MDYNDSHSHKKENKEHRKDKMKGPPTPASDPAGDFGGCILGLGNEFNKNLSDGLNFIFDSNSIKDNINDSNNNSNNNNNNNSNDNDDDDKDDNANGKVRIKVRYGLELL